MNFLNRESYSLTPFPLKNCKNFSAILKGMNDGIQSEPLHSRKLMKISPSLRTANSKFWMVGKEGDPVACKEGRKNKGMKQDYNILLFCCALARNYHEWN